MTEDETYGEDVVKEEINDWFNNAVKKHEETKKSNEGKRKRAMEFKKSMAKRPKGQND